MEATEASMEVKRIIPWLQNSMGAPVKAFTTAMEASVDVSMEVSKEVWKGDTTDDSTMLTSVEVMEASMS